MNRKEIGLIVQGSGVLGIVVSLIFVSKINPILAIMAVLGMGAIIVGHFIKK